MKHLVFAAFSLQPMSVLLASLLASFALIGCQAEVVDGPSPDVEVGEADQPLLNCKAQCVKIYRICVQSTDDYESCVIERDACMLECDDPT
ncbi:hypothetical protein WMF18_08750 [Sorangium sp. So ce315]|uniref:hypothetical protein n=1 Tax=Sorangium sp. So ce315 TaxID=3133299 RepID=UPI003F61683C